MKREPLLHIQGDVLIENCSVTIMENGSDRRCRSYDHRCSKGRCGPDNCRNSNRVCDSNKVCDSNRVCHSNCKRGTSEVKGSFSVKDSDSKRPRPEDYSHWVNFGHFPDDSPEASDTDDATYLILSGFGDTSTDDSYSWWRDALDQMSGDPYDPGEDE